MSLKHDLLCWLTALSLTAPALAEEAPAVMMAAVPAAPSVPPMPPKQVLLEKALDLQSGKIDSRVLRIALPKGYKTPQHLHEGGGPRYVVKGRVRIEEGGQVQEYGPGQVFWETGAIMTAENISDGEAELIIFEIVPRQEPASSSIPETK